MNNVDEILMRKTINFNGRISKEQIKRSIDNTYLINFDVTEKCNLRCEYCGFGPLYSNKGEREQRSLNVNYAYKLIDFVFENFRKNERLAKDRVVYIGFYGGEPLLCMDLIKKIVEYAEISRDLSISLRFALTTNGTLLKKHAAYLVQNNFRLLLSLDGNKIHNSYRVYPNGKESFDVVKSNIDFLQRNYTSYFKSQVHFNSVIHRRNDVSAVKEFISIEYDKIPATPSVSETGVEECMVNEFKNICKESRSDISINNVYKYIKQMDGVVYANYSDLIFTKSQNESRYPTATCIPFSKKIHMSVDGLLFPCEKTSRNYKFGCVTEEGVQIFYEDIVKEVNKRYDEIQKLCNACEQKLFCQLCIFSALEPAELTKCPNFSKEVISEGVFLEKFRNDPKLYKYLIDEYYVF
ncbi:radical SAM peptide maturase [Labilibaculum manganireducens]|uniref:Radical SAM peptide maturase n=1 Tax=Labilibaculum manganireducens TaxID=1940525 RepID=A0A2N3HVN4_9BACT|nr:radical SAM peptide maturase [Labilibaculum manganireducens]PKQ62136.1 radical SAM peptide maturase [Labilibaculum manganireducens]